MKTKNSKKSLTLFIPAVTMALSSCNKNSTPASLSTTPSSVQSSTTSYSSSKQSIWYEVKILSKPGKTDVVDLRDVYKVGEEMNFSINNMTGHNLIVKINNIIIEPDVNLRYKYIVAENDQVLVITITEDIKKIVPVFNYTPADLAKYVSVRFLDESKESFSPGDSLYLRFSKSEGYSFKTIKLNGEDITQQIVNDIFYYLIPSDVTQLVFDIVVSYDQSTIKLNIESNDASSFIITNYKNYYQANEQANIKITPKDYYKIENIKLNGTIINPSDDSSTSETKIYSFKIPSASPEITLTISSIPKQPIIRGDIFSYNESSKITSSLDKIPGMKVQILDMTDGSYQTTTDVIFDSGASSYIVPINNDNGAYYTNHNYTIKLLIPDGSSLKEVQANNGVKVGLDNSKYIQNIIIPSTTDLTFTGECDLPTLPITLKKGESSKIVDNGNNVVIAATKKNVSISYKLQYTGKLVDDNGNVITEFNTLLSSSEIDFDYQFSLSDYKSNTNNYYFRIYHNSTDKQYYVTHNLQNGYTNIRPLTSQYIKALCNGKLIITFNRTIKDGSYFYNCTLKIEDKESETNNLQGFTRSVTSSPATFIGSKMEASNLFQDDINKGDFIISSYHISCSDNI